MISVLLSIVGLIIIVLSLFLISRVLQREEELYNEIHLIYNDIKNYSSVIENSLDDFHELLQSNLNRMEILDNDVERKINKEIDKENYIDETFTDNLRKVGNDGKLKHADEILYQEIRSLKKMGLSNEEISKSANRSIREVEMMIKIWDSRKL